MKPPYIFHTVLVCMGIAYIIGLLLYPSVRYAGYEKGYLEAMETMAPQIQHLSGEYRRGYREAWDTAWSQIGVAPPAHFPSDL